MTLNGNGTISTPMFRWVIGGIATLAVLYGGFLVNAVNKISDKVDLLDSKISLRVDKIDSKLEDVVPRGEHERVWGRDQRDFDRLEGEIKILAATKADTASIVHDQAALEERIDELNQRLGYGPQVAPRTRGGR